MPTWSKHSTDTAQFVCLNIQIIKAQTKAKFKKIIKLIIDSKAGKTEAEFTNISTLFSGLLKHFNWVQNEINNISKSVGFTKLWFHLILWRVTFQGPWDCFCLSFWFPNVDYHIVWKRLNSPTIRLCNWDTMFLLIHNKLAVPERLHRTGFRDQPYCSYCPGNIISNVEHYFCQY